MNLNNIQKTSLNIAGYEVCPIPTGIFGLDGGAMFGTVPKVLWNQTNPADEQNRIPMEARALLLKKPGCNILIDCGNGQDFIAKYGEKLGHKFADMYAIDPNGASLKKSLLNHGIDFSDIDHVILTHLHFDHCGGATCAHENIVDSLLLPQFPNAKYYIQKQNLETAQKPNLREKASYFSANYQPLIDHNCLVSIHGQTENLLPGVSVYLSHGHTQGQQVIVVKDEQNGLMYCGDMTPTSSHVRIPWLMGYDLNPLLLMEEKQQFLSQAAENNWYLFFEHDPYCDAAQIEKKGQDFAVKNRFHITQK